MSSAHQEEESIVIILVVTIVTVVTVVSVATGQNLADGDSLDVLILSISHVTVKSTLRFWRFRCSGRPR